MTNYKNKARFNMKKHESAKLHSKRSIWKRAMLVVISAMWLILRTGQKNRLEYLILVNIIRNFTFCSK